MEISLLGEGWGMWNPLYRHVLGMKIDNYAVPITLVLHYYYIKEIKHVCVQLFTVFCQQMKDPMLI